MIGLNEVGAAPGNSGMSVEQFHQYCAHMQATHPLTMTTLSTHDTKRCDDVRARLAVLTEMPGQWNAPLHRWSKIKGKFKVNNFPAPTPKSFLPKTLLGGCPIS